MGQKVNPTAFRLGIVYDWLSRWFSERDYAKYVFEDKKVRDFVKRGHSDAGIVSIVIERSASIVKLILTVARPGVLIGRGGSGLAQLRDELTTLTKSKIDLEVQEFKNPELSAQLVGDEVARSIERRMPVRRTMNNIAERVFAKGVLGVKIICSGVISGPSSISRRERVVRGSIPTQTLRARVDFAKSTAFTTYGTIGIKVWIFHTLEGI